jgi:hypothetical protein
MQPMPSTWPDLNHPGAPALVPAVVVALWPLLLLAGPEAAIARTLVEPAAPVQTIDSDALRQLPAGRKLEQAINQLRQGNGVPPLAPLPAALRGVSTTYSRKILLGMLQGRPCDHDLTRWQGFQNELERIDGIRPSSELLGCPKPSDSWSAVGLVTLWSRSSIHNRILNRTDRSHLSCEVVESQKRKAALCILWQERP